MANYTKRPKRSKKNGGQEKATKLVLITAVIQLIIALIELIKEIIE